MAKLKHFLTLLTIVCAFNINGINCDVFAECSDTALDGQFIATNISCAHFIFCDGNDSFDGECADGNYFNQLFQTCDPQDTVDCILNNTNINNNNNATIATTVANGMTNETATTANAVNTIISTLLSNVTVASTDMLNSNVTAATQAQTGTTTAIQTGQTGNTNGLSTASPGATSATNAIATTASTLGTSSSTATTTGTNGLANTTTSEQLIVVQNVCPPNDNPNTVVYLINPNSCTDYYFCYRGEPLPMHCTKMLHFNPQIGECDYPENVGCQIEHVTARQQCQSHTIDTYPHPSNCNYFYYCNNGYLLLQQCPIFFGWDYKKRACISHGIANCYNNRTRF